MKRVAGRIAVVLALTVVIGWLLPSALHAEPFAYIANEGDDTVSVIDTATNTVTATIPVGDGPFFIAVHPNGSTVYISNSREGTVSVIDTATNTVTATIPVGGDLIYGLAMAPNGNFLYIVDGASDSISVIDTATNTVIDTIFDIGALPVFITILPDGSTLYVGSVEGPTSVIDTFSLTEITTIEPSVGFSFTAGLAVHPDGSKVYRSNIGSHTVEVIDTATNTVITAIVVGSVEDDAGGLAVSPDGSSVYVAGDYFVYVIDTVTNTVTNSIPIEGRGSDVGVHPDGSAVYVTHSPSTVSVIDTTTHTVISKVTVGSSPYGLIITPLTQQPPVVTIDDVINYFDESVSDGSLTAVWRYSRVILRRMLIYVQNQIDQGNIDGAMSSLNNISLRCDGRYRPADLVQGPAVSELHSMVLELMDSLASP